MKLKCSIKTGKKGSLTKDAAWRKKKCWMLAGLVSFHLAVLASLAASCNNGLHRIAITLWQQVFWPGFSENYICDENMFCHFNWMWSTQMKEKASGVLIPHGKSSCWSNWSGAPVVGTKGLASFWLAPNKDLQRKDFQLQPQIGDQTFFT